MRPWTRQQDDELIGYVRRYIDPGYIAQRMGRTPKAIEHRVQKLRAIGRLTTPAVMAYRPEDGRTTRCVVCDTRFTRARVTQRYCGHRCSLVADRVPEPTVRSDGICPRCGERPRKARPGGGLRGWCAPCESKQKTQYMRTEAGKAAMARYLATEKGQQARRRAQKAYEARQKGAT